MKQIYFSPLQVIWIFCLLGVSIMASLNYVTAQEIHPLQSPELTALHPQQFQNLLSNIYFKASNTGFDDNFGRAIAISGNTLVVGAAKEDSNATGINGEQSDNSALDAGAVYVFTLDNGVWSQQAYLKASNTETEDLFGYAVAIYGDTIVVGAYQEDSNATGVNGNQNDNSASNSGAAYVFTRTEGIWSQQAYLKASNSQTFDSFGRTVTIFEDTIAVGASGEDSNATGVNGNQDNNSALSSGAVYVFTRTGGVWSQQAYLKASNTEQGDIFGSAVSLDNQTLVVGAWEEDSDATGVNGNQNNNSALNSGAVYVFTRTENIWTQQAYIKASNTEANDLLSREGLVVRGNMLLVGAMGEDSNATGVNGDQTNNSAPDSGAAYLFTYADGVWSQDAYFKASNPDSSDLFGFGVALNDSMIVIGAGGETSNATGVNGNQNDNSLYQAGAVYIFVKTNNMWVQQAYVKASNTDGNDVFGLSVALQDEEIIIGAPGESSNATGINGDQENDSANLAGAVYMMQLGNPKIYLPLILR